MIKHMALTAVALNVSQPATIDLDVIEVELPEGKLTEEISRKIADTMFAPIIKKVGKENFTYEVTLPAEKRAIVRYFNEETRSAYTILLYAFHIQQVEVA